MKKILLLLLLLPALLFAQNQGGVIIVGGVAVHQPDTSAYKVINTIQSEGTALSGNNRFYVTYLVAISKRDSLWQKSKAFYGFIGGTSASHKWNWKDMRDLDVAYRLTFPNGMTHTANGIQGNGTNQYANTFLTPSTVLSSSSNNITLYIKSSSAFTGNTTPITIGSLVNSSTVGSMAISNRHNGTSNTKYYTASGNIPNDIANLPSPPASPLLGVVMGNVLLNNIKLINNGVELNTTKSKSAFSQLPNTNIYIMANNAISGSENYDNKLINFTSIGSGLTDTQAIQSSNTVPFAQGIVGRK